MDRCHVMLVSLIDLSSKVDDVGDEAKRSYFPTLIPPSTYLAGFHNIFVHTKGLCELLSSLEEQWLIPLSLNPTTPRIIMYYIASMPVVTYKSSSSQ